jgi:hypothetical protein
MWDVNSVEPKRRLPSIILCVSFLLILLCGWILQSSVLPVLNLDSAKTVISFQIPITSGLFALFVAILIYNKKITVEMSEKLRNSVNNFLRNFEVNFVQSEGNKTRDIDFIYGLFYKYAKQQIVSNKKGKQTLETLANLWVIKELSKVYETRGTIALQISPKSQQLYELEALDNKCIDVALDTWDNYHRNISKFMLTSIKTFNYVFDSLEKIRETNIELNENDLEPFKQFPKTVSELVTNDSKLLSERVTFVKSSSQFIDTFIISTLAIAIVSGIISILCLNIQSLLYLQPYVQNALLYLTFIPLGLSSYGLFLVVLKVIFVLIR